MAKLTRNGVVGLELTREEIADAIANIDAIVRKAQCREVNSDVIDILDEARGILDRADSEITQILED
jgi:hypothetical protein